jgi:hypothetical protein
MRLDMPFRDQDTTDTSQDQLKDDITKKPVLPQLNIKKIMARRGGKLINKGSKPTPILLNPRLPNTEPGGEDSQTARSESTFFPTGTTIQEINQAFTDRFSVVDSDTLSMVEKVYDSIQEVSHPHQLPHHNNPVPQTPMMMVKRKLEVTPLVANIRSQKNSKIPKGGNDIKINEQPPKQVQDIIQ